MGHVGYKRGQPKLLWRCSWHVNVHAWHQKKKKVLSLLYKVLLGVVLPVPMVYSLGTFLASELVLGDNLGAGYSSSGICGYTTAYHGKE